MDKQKSNAFMLKLVGDVSTALAGALLVVGDRAGLFKAMANAGALTPATLAERSGIGERYVQEWLAVMAGAGYVEYDAEQHSFTLPDEHALFLADSESEYYLASLFQSLPTMAAAIPQLVDAFKHGGGVSFKDYGSELPRTLADMNRTVYESRLVKTWMPFMPEVVQRLTDGGRALDVGCGMGVVPLALARGFPAAHITGIDVDAHSIALAKARSAEIEDPQRLQYQQLGVEELPTDTGWDFISTFDVIHDLPDPVAALGHMRRALNQGGTYFRLPACCTASVVCTASRSRWHPVASGWERVGEKNAHAHWPHKPVSSTSSDSIYAARLWLFTRCVPEHFKLAEICNLLCRLGNCW
ncbi:MAG: class I SAM-dependent methyltransferase [Burkholderiales bacterium]|nr:class I SAM-dependent methyltransferase [Burkholderiales bacterium]